MAETGNNTRRELKKRMRRTIRRIKKRLGLPVEQRKAAADAAAVQGKPPRRRKTAPGEEKRSLIPGGVSPLLIAVDIVLLACVVASGTLCTYTAMQSPLYSVTVNADGIETVYLSTGVTVGELINMQNIDYDPAEDILSCTADAALYDGMEIVLTRAFPVAVESEGEVTVLHMAEGTVGDALALANVVRDSDDELSHLAYADVTAGMKILHTNVEISYTTALRLISHVQEVIKDADEWESFRKVEQEGSDGERRVTQRITVKNGIEVSREIVDQTVLVPAVNEIVRVGTKIRYQTNYEGEWRRYIAPEDKPRDGVNGWKAITVYRVTAYCTGSRTATGTRPKLGTIAVNPKYIPYGTKVWVPGYGMCTAEDTGAFRNYPSPRDNAIDLWFNTEREARNWGSKYNYTILVRTG